MTPSVQQPTSDFVDDLRKRMASLRPAQTSHHRSVNNTPSDDPLRRFRDVQFAYVRIDASKPPLVRPYSGPFEIIEKHQKYFVISQKGKFEKVSVDRLKPAFGNFNSVKPVQKPNLINRLYKLANYSRTDRSSSQAPPPAGVPAPTDVPTPRPLYRDALVAPPTANPPVVTRSSRVSVPVSRYSP